MNRLSEWARATRGMASMRSSPSSASTAAKPSTCSARNETRHDKPLTNAGFIAAHAAVTQAVRCPFAELGLPDENGVEPAAVLYLRGSQPLSPPARARLRQIHERTHCGFKLVSGDWCLLVGIHRATVDGTLSPFLEIASAPPIESDASSVWSVFSQEVDIEMLSFPVPHRIRRISGRRR
jgi:hypothetical protein